MANINPIKISSIKAIRSDVIVYDMDTGERKTKGGILLRNDDGQTHGIRARWAKVYCVGPEQKDVKPGQWILIEHGRWTRQMAIEDQDGVKKIQKVDIKGMLAVSDEMPNLEDQFIPDSL
jgi:co-chaperonin GroES (HSP10)